MKTEKYTLDEVKSKLKAAAPPVGASVTSADEMRQAICDEFVDWVEDYYWHTNYDKENHKIVAQVNRFTATLQAEEWASNERKDNADKRDHLVGRNKLLRTQLGLAELDPSGTHTAQYCMDPFIEPRIKQAMDFDEARACGGTCHSDDPELAYHVIDLEKEFSGKGYIVADISQQQYEEWREELKRLLEGEKIASIRIKKQEEQESRDETNRAVDKFVTNWAAERSTILGLKQGVLEQRLVERQIRNLEANNAELVSELTEVTDGDLGDNGEKGVF
jgi:hypothetical protein|tara:strand:+ start:34 stop:861 length:828 start_codon:yes stop_codon:yes gene_type:complete